METAICGFDTIKEAEKNTGMSQRAFSERTDITVCALKVHWNRAWIMEEQIQ